MAMVHRYPALVWQDHQGGWSARLLEREEPVGFGRSRAAALDQLEDFLTWLYTEEPWQPLPDFHAPELLHQRVPVRPEYTVEHRRFPCDESITLRVPVVRGRQKHGLLACALPTLGTRFYYHEAEALKGLVQHYVQQLLESKTPSQLARYLPPTQVVLEWIVVKVPTRTRNPQHEARLPALSAVAETVGDPAFRRQFSRPYERDQQVAALVTRLGHERAHVLLVGEPGAGKTTVLAEAVRQLARSGDPEKEDDAPPPRHRYWQTSAGRLISGMRYLGQWEERCEQIIAELDAIGGVLCIDNLLDLVRLGGNSPTDSLAAFFLPYLQRGELRMVAEATPQELDACRRLFPGLVDVFQVLALPTFGRTEALSVLTSQTAAFRSNLHVETERGVVERVYHLFRRFLPYGAFPGKAGAFLQDVYERARQARKTLVTQDDVLAAFVRQTGLPELFLRDEVTLAESEVRSAFAQQVLGQDEACSAAVDLVLTFKAGMNDPARPLGVLLFSGPTGVGKTEMARAIARYFFGHGDQADRVFRLDMSEYTGWRAGERLMTRPDGEPSELIQRVRQQPFQVILFDEIEKADPEVFDVLLGVFDEGRLTDRFGRLTSFRTTVLIMTSNLGAGRRETFGFGPRAGADYASEAMAFFRPEFFNRIDQVVTFQPLGPAIIRAITRKELHEIALREGIRRAGITLAWTPAVEDRLAREGFDERYGARPLQRTLEALVVTPLARFLLERPEVRHQTVHVDVASDGSIQLSVARH
ncbi:MAG: AAA family ATPase [Gemmataceae bacterium]